MSLLRRLTVQLRIDALLRRLSGQKGVVLMLHRLERPGAEWSADPGMAVTPDSFLQTITTLRRCGYDLVSLDEALRRLREPARPFACLTFDDGFRDNHDLLWPLLRREDIPATIYLTTGFLDGTALPWWQVLERLVAGNSAMATDSGTLPAADAEEKTRSFRLLSSRLAAQAETARKASLEDWAGRAGTTVSQLCCDLFLDWHQVRRMAVEGSVTFGAHTLSHPHLSRLSETEAFREITASAERIAGELGRRPRHFAYPFGLAADAGAREHAMAAKAGFTSAVHAFGGPVRATADLFALPRIPLGGGDSQDDLRLRLSGAKGILRRLVAARTVKMLSWEKER